MRDKGDKYEALRHGDEVMSDDELAKFLTQEEVKMKTFF